MKKFVKFATSRMGSTAITVLIELVFLLFLYFRLNNYFAWIELILRVLSIIVVLVIISFSRHLSSDLMWIVLIMLIPVGGTLIYLFLEVMEYFSSRTHAGLVREAEAAKTYFDQDEALLKEALENPDFTGHLNYLKHSAGYSVYRNTGYTYYPLGELGFEAMKAELSKAEKFIFLEYFIIEPGVMWDSLLEILKEKAAGGVDVRVLYDDMGSIGTLPAKYVRTLKAMGIRAQAFNRISPVLNGIMNHRDHRKILVIDGKTAFSGGINLADEYINRKEKYGHWKDNCIRIKGKAVWSYTVMFLSIWNASKKEDPDYTIFRASDFPEEGPADGYIVPYADTPLDGERTGEEIYLNILNRAKRYCYIVTPYLILDSDMLNALILTAKRGVDVRIITPGIPDKKIVWRITRSNYFHLILNGIKIYEYTPGFIHGKIFVCDDEIATVGTINLDYRSLYLHFENGTALFGSKQVPAVKDDVLKTLEDCHEMTLQETYIGLARTFLFMIIRIFSPL
ncbi:MAG: cardiolipin synthase, partial [Lachnospiraceae bacterium]|nr:cardiolipin synthase [Lachnospiraceae bacterium]